MMTTRTVLVLLAATAVVTAVVTRRLSAPLAAPPPTSALHQPLQPCLTRHVDRLVLVNDTLPQALVKLAEASRTNILLNDFALTSAGVDLDQRRTLTLNDVDVNHALQLILAAYVDRTISAAGYAESDNVITVSTRDDTDRNFVVTYGYDVRDFADRFILPNDVRPPPPYDTRGAYLNAPSLFGSAAREADITRQRFLDESPADQAAHALAANGSPRVVTRYSRQECLDLLTRLIEEAIDPDTWRDNGGQTGALREAGGVLFINQTPANHDRVRRLLYNLRRLREAIDRHDPPGVRPVDLFAPIPVEVINQGNHP